MEHHSLPLICAFLSVCCFSYKSSRLAGNEIKLTIPLRNGDERKCGLEMWGGPTPLSIMPQTWTLWPLPVPNLIPSYDPEQSGPGLSLRMTGKTQPMEKSVCIATWRRCKNKLAQTPLRSAKTSEGNRPDNAHTCSDKNGKRQEENADKTSNCPLKPTTSQLH